MDTVHLRVKRLFSSLAIVGFVALILLITATAALGGVWLPGQEPSEPVSAPHEMDQMYRPSFRTIPPMTLPAPPKPKPKPVVAAAPEVSSGRCGGSLPSCSIMECESKGSLTARNPSGAAGKWQIMPGTWNGYGGYSSADQAPESVQDAKARELWAGGAGSGHWRQCL